MVLFGGIGSVCEIDVCDWNQRVCFCVIYVWCWSEHESSTRRQPGRSAVRARCDAPPRDCATNEATFAVAQGSDQIEYRCFFYFNNDFVAYNLKSLLDQP